MENIVQQIHNAQNILLTTHRQCDGDGLGAQLALYYALKKIKKNVQVVNVDRTPRKYRYLQPDQHITYFLEAPQTNTQADLCLVFDTNDERLLAPLFDSIKQNCKHIFFIDHHPVLKEGPQPTTGSYINTTCASTGEIAYEIIRKLNIPLDKDIARCLYTSITFDTQLYRYIRNSPTSHTIAAELLKYDIQPEEIHRHLFGNQTINKMAFLAQALGKVEYFAHGQLAVLGLQDQDLTRHHLEADESRDLIDMLMNIDTLEAAVILREEAPQSYKLSLRSKNKMEVIGIAEKMGGGGHSHAAGASVQGNYAEIKDKVVKLLLEELKKN